jgi:hypothetical protein
VQGVTLQPVIELINAAREGIEFILGAERMRS